MFDLATIPYKVIAHSVLDGLQVDHFQTMQEAEAFAEDVSLEGYTAMICPVVAVYPPARGETSAPPVRVGIDYPYTLNPSAA